MTPVENLIADCDLVQRRLLKVDLQAPSSSIARFSESVLPGIKEAVDNLAITAARIDTMDPPPESPKFVFSMTTPESVALAIGYVKRLRRWAESLLPKPPAREQYTRQGGAAGQAGE